MSDLKENIVLEVNGQKMPKDTYEIIKFIDGSIKIKVTYHNQPGFFKDDIQENPETFDPADHSALFTEEEKTNLSQSMRP